MAHPTLRSRPDGPIWPALVALAVLLHGATTWAWLRANGLPDGFQNEFMHLSFAAEVFYRLRAGDLPGLHYYLFEEYYPPLLHLGAAAFMGASGPGEDAAAASNVLWLGVLAASVYGLGARLRGPRAGALAAVLCLLYPSVFGNARRLEPNVVLTAMVAASAWALAASSGFRRRRESLAFGALAGLGMLADRLSFALFLGLPVALAVWDGLRGAPGRGARRRVLTHAGWAALVALALCGYYYLNFARIHLAEITGQVVAGEVIETGEATERRGLWHWTNWAYYGVSLLDSQMGLVLGVAALFGVRGALRHGPKDDERLVVAWGLGSIALFTLIHKKQPFYTVPALPALALMTAVALHDLRLPWARRAGVAALVVLGLHQHAALTGLWRPLVPADGPDPGGRALRALAGGSLFPSWWADHELTQASPPRPAPADLGVAKRALVGAGFDPGRDRVVLLSDSEDFPEVFAEPMAKLRFGTREVDGALLNPEAVRERWETARFFVYVSGDPLRSWPRDEDVISAMDRWKGWEDDGALLAAFHAMGERAVRVPQTGSGPVPPDGEPRAGLFVWELRGDRPRRPRRSAETPRPHPPSKGRGPSPRRRSPRPPGSP